MIEGHRTNAEKAVRAEWEKKLKSGDRMRGTPDLAGSKAAKKQFNRLKKIFDGCDLDEAFYETTLSRYSYMVDEHRRMCAEREKLAELSELLDDRQDEMELEDYLKLRMSMNESLEKKDKSIAKLRDQLLAIEKDNLMTVQGKIRAVPKEPQEEETSGIAAIRARRLARGG